MLSDRKELASGWELANDQFKRNNDKKNYISKM